MTKADYLKAIEKLGLRPTSEETANVLGYGRRHLFRIVDGEYPVPAPMRKLLRLALKHRLSAEHLKSL